MPTSGVPKRACSSAPAAAIASAIASIVSRVHALRRAWRSHVTARADPSSLVVTVNSASAPLRSRQLQLLAARGAIHHARLLLAHRQGARSHRLHIEAGAELAAQRVGHA